MAFTAPAGTNFRTASGITIASLRQSLEAIADFIKSRDVYGYLLRYDDWWQHDGEPVPKGKLSWEAFADRYGNEAAITASMPKRDKVRVGICGPGMEWYLRYIADPSDGSASLDLTVPREWEEDFLEVAEGLSPMEWVRSPAEEYYRLVRKGAIPVSAGRAVSREGTRAPDARYGRLAEDISFGGGFGWIFQGKIVAAVLAACVLFLGYLWLSDLYYRF
ncbi:MAG TPA: hypothetical protein VJ385_01120 [Fibrobacteria bacterium]|nr:hypothetical protein [Fibrobacteria bacterium]